MGTKTKCDPGSVLKPLILSGVTTVFFSKAKTFWTIDGSFKISRDFLGSFNFMTNVFSVGQESWLDSFTLIFSLFNSIRSKVLVCSCHVTYAFQSESTLCSCLSVKGLLPQNRCDIWSLSDSNGIRTHNRIVCKWTLNHVAELAKLASLAKWLSVRIQTKWLWA